MVSSPANPHSVAIYPGVIKCSQSRRSPGKRCRRAVEEKRKPCHWDRWGLDSCTYSTMNSFTYLAADGNIFPVWQMFCQMAAVISSIADLSHRLHFVPKIWCGSHEWLLRGGKKTQEQPNQHLLKVRQKCATANTDQRDSRCYVCC